MLQFKRSLKASIVLLAGWRRKGARFKQLCFQADQHGSGKEGFAGFRQILFIAAPHTCSEPRLGDTGLQLVEKSVDNGDDVDIPGIQITPFGCVLQQTDGETGSSLGQEWLREQKGERSGLGPFRCPQGNGRTAPIPAPDQSARVSAEVSPAAGSRPSWASTVAR